MDIYQCPDTCRVKKQFKDVFEYDELSNIALDKKLRMVKMVLTYDESWKPSNFVAIVGLIESYPPILHYFVEYGEPLEVPNGGRIYSDEPYVNKTYKREYLVEEPNNYTQNLFMNLIKTDAPIVKGNYIYENPDEEFLPDMVIRRGDFIQHPDIKSNCKYDLTVLDQMQTYKIAMDNYTCKFQAGFLNSNLRSQMKQR